MDFTVPGSVIEFSIPDEWWAFSECVGFKPSSGFYFYSNRDDPEINIVPVAEVEPPRRDVGIARFTKHKLVPVLLAITAERRILPPLKVVAIENPQYRYRLIDGFHRFHASIALGYPFIPIVVAKGGNTSAE